METLRPLLDQAMGEKQWEIVRDICRAVLEDDEIFENINVKYLILGRKVYISIINKL